MSECVLLPGLPLVEQQQQKSWVKATDAYVKSYDIYGETKKIKVESRFGLSLFITNLVITSSLGRSPCV